MPAGRPTIKTPELIEEICLWLESGKSLASFCAIEDHPSSPTVFAWLEIDPEFLNRYTRSRERQQEYLLDALSDIAEDEAIEPNRAAQIIKARSIMAEKLAPKKYAPVSKREHSGPDGGPIQHQTDLSGVSTETLLQLKKELGE